MIKLIREIRKQPEFVRHIFMWTMVVITFSVVGLAWFEQTRQDFLALLKEPPAPAQTDSAPEPKSPFRAIGSSLSDFQANILELITGKNDQRATPLLSPVPPRRLP